MISKSLSKILSRDYKTTQQGVSNILLSYLYNLHIVCASDKYSCPNVHALAMSILYVYHEINMLLTCTLT